MHDTQRLYDRHKDVSGPRRPRAPARMIHLTNDKVAAYGERHTSSTCYNKTRYQCSRKDFCPYRALTPGSPSPKVLRSDNPREIARGSWSSVSVRVKTCSGRWRDTLDALFKGPAWELSSPEPADENQETSHLRSPFTLLSH